MSDLDFDTATDPKTGNKMVYLSPPQASDPGKPAVAEDRPNRGSWWMVQASATHPQTGQKAYQVGGRWYVQPQPKTGIAGAVDKYYDFLRGATDVTGTGLANWGLGIADAAGNLLFGEQDEPRLPRVQLGAEGERLRRQMKIPFPGTPNGLDVSDEELRATLDPGNTQPIEALRDEYRKVGQVSVAKGLDWTDHPTLARWARTGRDIGIVAQVAIPGLRWLAEQGSINPGVVSSGILTQGLENARINFRAGGFTTAQDAEAAAVGFRNDQTAGGFAWWWAGKEGKATHVNLNNDVAAHLAKHDASLINTAMTEEERAAAQMTDSSMEAAIGPARNVYDRMFSTLRTNAMDDDLLDWVEQAIHEPDAPRLPQIDTDMKPYLDFFSQRGPDGARIKYARTGPQIQATMSRLRHFGFTNITSEDAYANALGRAQLEMADVLEEHVARNVHPRSQTSFEQFLDAREAIARWNTVQAVRVGTDIHIPALVRLARKRRGRIGGALRIAAWFGEQPRNRFYTGGYMSLRSGASVRQMMEEGHGKIGIWHHTVSSLVRWSGWPQWALRTGRAYEGRWGRLRGPKGRIFGEQGFVPREAARRRPGLEVARSLFRGYNPATFEELPLRADPAAVEESLRWREARQEGQARRGVTELPPRPGESGWRGVTPNAPPPPTLPLDAPYVNPPEGQLPPEAEGAMRELYGESPRAIDPTKVPPTEPQVSGPFGETEDVQNRRAARQHVEAGLRAAEARAAERDRPAEPEAQPYEIPERERPEARAGRAVTGADLEEYRRRTGYYREGLGEGYTPGQRAFAGEGEHPEHPTAQAARAFNRQASTQAERLADPSQTNIREAMRARERGLREQLPEVRPEPEVPEQASTLEPYAEPPEREPPPEKPWPPPEDEEPDDDGGGGAPPAPPAGGGGPPPGGGPGGGPWDFPVAEQGESWPNASATETNRYEHARQTAKAINARGESPDGKLEHATVTRDAITVTTKENMGKAGWQVATQSWPHKTGKGRLDASKWLKKQKDADAEYVRQLREIHGLPVEQWPTAPAAKTKAAPVAEAPISDMDDDITKEWEAEDEKRDAEEDAEIHDEIWRELISITQNKDRQAYVDRMMPTPLAAALERATRELGKDAGLTKQLAAANEKWEAIKRAPPPTWASKPEAKPSGTKPPKPAAKKAPAETPAQRQEFHRKAVEHVNSNRKAGNIADQHATLLADSYLLTQLRQTAKGWSVVTHKMREYQKKGQTGEFVFSKEFASEKAARASYDNELRQRHNVMYVPEQTPADQPWQPDPETIGVRGRPTPAQTRSGKPPSKIGPKYKVGDKVQAWHGPRGTGRWRNAVIEGVDSVGTVTKIGWDDPAPEISDMESDLEVQRISKGIDEAKARREAQATPAAPKAEATEAEREQIRQKARAQWFADAEQRRKDILSPGSQTLPSHPDRPAGQVTRVKDGKMLTQIFKSGDKYRVTSTFYPTNTRASVKDLDLGTGKYDLDAAQKEYARQLREYHSPTAAPGEESESLKATRRAVQKEEIEEDRSRFAERRAAQAKKKPIAMEPDETTAEEGIAWWKEASPKYRQSAIDELRSILDEGYTVDDFEASDKAIYLQHLNEVVETQGIDGLDEDERQIWAELRDTPKGKK